MSDADGRSVCCHHLHLRYRFCDGLFVCGTSFRDGGQLSIAFIFDPLDLGGGYDVMDVIVD